jgi:hypothetical protein
MVGCGVWGVGGRGGEKGGVEGSRAADWVEDAERTAGGVAAAVRVVVPCSAALVVVVSFVSAVVGVLLVVPVAVATWSVVAGSETKAVWSIVAGVPRPPVLPRTPRLQYLRQGEAVCRAEEVLHLEVWPEAWVARWHACSSLVIWAHRRVVEVARELLRVAEELEEDSHASACCAERSRCVLVYTSSTEPEHPVLWNLCSRCSPPAC